MYTIAPSEQPAVKYQKGDSVAMLHITNGQGVDFRDTGLPGEVVYWKDVLHEGPTPPGLSLAEMSRVRTGFIASCGWGRPEQIAQDFAQRDTAIERFSEHEEVILWFEHDLYDQLQLIQILDWFLTRDRSSTHLSIICVGKFPGIGRFKGLGQLSPRQLASLFSQRQPITLADLKLASEAWAVFCSPDPSDIEYLLNQRMPSLPFLKGALTRHLEQFPSVRNGLSRTEQQILDIVASGTNLFQDIFLTEQDREERVFLGDSAFRLYVNRMHEVRNPLVDVNGQLIKLAPAGRGVLACKDDAVRLNGIDRWLGGVHLVGDDAEWRWDDKYKRLVRRNGGVAHRN